MPKRGAVALGLTAVALALLLNFQTPSQLPASTVRAGGSGPGPGPASGTTTGQGGTGSSGGAGQSGTGSPADSGGTTGARTVTGPTVETRFGPVQVQVTLNGHQITDVTALQLPVGGRSGAISNYVDPVLRSEALQAQGPNIDGVSGATYTSLAYAQSLQAALNSAGG